ncbi:putative ABC transporter permease [Caloramator sp. mosi_1]|uniref:putative ABC transporter permease n=1 Tax=Caloramator sp. mosi_1 TaxID=3023090 RepID=UPI002360D2B2|nr:putative ABC transporter permease [Caloramator sp. mosi_1]WDC83760.1 putative ABC transporter permease [Caloramator sp. mosi_1]
MNKFYYIFLSFLIYAFFGWIIEVLYHIYKDKRFINRGFLYGPICPIYGFSAVVFIITLAPFKNNPLIVFLIGLVIASIIEYLTGYLLEVLFHSKWWDYSNERFNIKGYVCLKFSVYWGVFAVIFMNLIHPKIDKLILCINEKFNIWIYNVLLTCILLDALLTINNLFKLKSIYIELQDILTEIKSTIEKLSETVSIEARLKLESRIETLSYVKEKILSKLSFKQKLLLRSYPKIKSNKFENALQHIKERYKLNG